ncbi:exo-beta-N-acetylmuramidase NamZ family protein [Lacrimispora brassicae]
MVKNGIDCVDRWHKALNGKRLGLVTSVSGVDRHLNSTIDILHKKYRLTALFGPEHGVRGNIGAGGDVENYMDPDTGLPVYSLYRKNSKRLTREMLDQVDAVVYDIQDLGVRYYTYISTMIYALEECARFEKELIILDRYNPLGDQVEGNCLKPGFESFIGAYPLCMRYGLTVGELALMVNEEKNLGCRLTVIPCEGWNRHTMHPETGHVWVMPSPGMPRYETALVYAGTCLFEGTNISEGRGTTAPFEIIGAPFVDAGKLVKHMTEKRLPGVLFSPAYFTPYFSKFKEEACEGIHIHVIDSQTFRSTLCGLELLDVFQTIYEDRFAFLDPYEGSTRPMEDLLFGSDQLTAKRASKEELLAGFERDAKAFSERKKAYHLYE